MPKNNSTRRNILKAAGGGIGAFGLLGFTHTALAAGEVEYNQETLVQGSEVDIRVAWKEVYNGAVLESQDTAINRTTDGPVVTIGDLMPGDSGRVAFGIVVNEETSDIDQATISLRISPGPNGFAENGRNEPEMKAGDSTPNIGELQDAVDVTVWYDAGVLNTLPYGACDGDVTPTEGILASGTLAEITASESLGSWTNLATNPLTGSECLQDGQFLCLGVEWSVDSSVGNIVQGDSAKFDIEFGADPCSQ